MKNHYAIIQFRPDVARLEGVNVGVVVLVEGHAVRVRMSSNNNRVRSFFGESVFSDKMLSAIKTDLAVALEHIPPTLESLKNFIGARAGQLAFTPLQRVMISDPSEAANTLFEDLVGEMRSESKVYRFKAKWGRTETISGIFVATDEEIESALGIQGYLDDPCGRHSSGEFSLDRSMLTVLTDDKSFIEKAIAFGLLPTGVNPLYALKCELCGDVLPAPYNRCCHESCGWSK